MMKNTVADDYVDAAVTERWAEQIHLQKRSVGDPVPLAKAVGQPQGVDTNVAPEHPTLPGQAEEIRQLPGAAASLEHDGTVGELLIERCSEEPFSRLGD